MDNDKTEGSETNFINRQTISGEHGLDSNGVYV
jgi:hypothetical protein